MKSIKLEALSVYVFLYSQSRGYAETALMKIPSPRQPSPEPNLAQRNGNYVLPCPHCSVNNAFGWRCPQPIADPDADPENAWLHDDGTPPGHSFCGNWHVRFTARAGCMLIFYRKLVRTCLPWAHRQPRNATFVKFRFVA